MDGSLLVTAALALGLTGLFSLGLGAVYPLMVKSLSRLAPETRSNLLGFMAALPWILTLMLLLLAFLPPFLSIPGWIQAHCLPHIAHPHLCLSHGTLLTALQAVLLLLVFGMGLFGFWSLIAMRTRRDRLQIQSLLRLARREGDLNILGSSMALALSVGLLKPQTLVSKGLLERLSPMERDVLLTHEAEHAHRRDGMRLLFAELLLAAVPNRRQILADLALACEEACDRAAAKKVGSPECVVEALLKVQRLGMIQPAGVMGAMGSQLSLRVKALLKDDYGPTPLWARLVWLSPLVIPLMDICQHGLEHLGL